MPVEMIRKLTQDLHQVMIYCLSDADTMAEADPDFRIPFFKEDNFPKTLKNYEPVGGAEETKALRELYKATKKFMDEALIPSSDWVAGQTLSRTIPYILMELVKKNASVGAEILQDLQTGYMTCGNAFIQRRAGKMAAWIEGELSGSQKAAVSESENKLKAVRGVALFESRLIKLKKARPLTSLLRKSP